MYTVLLPFTCGQHYKKNDLIGSEINNHIQFYIDNGFVAKIETPEDLESNVENTAENQEKTTTNPKTKK